ncbi:NFATC2-interacting protein [Syngnathus typhle]|uniref:NFATC2-interacting protein n=1 Tax=Syngnathus typhle TaxID=161592 RepID=UPI002A6B365E|nr:NFATC2-interacting protein [Syngnathus typhle]
MAESLSDEDSAVAVKPAPKRRRILDSATIVPVPIYSKKVNSSLLLKIPVLTEYERPDNSDVDKLWSPTAGQKELSLTISDSDDEQEVKEESPLPSSPPSPADIPFQKRSRHSKKKINEVDRKLRAVNAVFSPNGVSTRGRRRDLPQQDADDVMIMTETGLQSCDQQVLKVRCRTDVYKLPVTTSTSVGQMLNQLADILGVPAFRLRLLRGEAELSSEANVGDLGLHIADILECVVMATDESPFITVRLQGNDRDSTREFSVHKEAALGGIFSQYVSALPDATKQKVKFHFDGCKVTEGQTPAQLDMEDGDIIEVWT